MQYIDRRRVLLANRERDCMIVAKLDLQAISVAGITIMPMMHGRANLRDDVGSTVHVSLSAKKHRSAFVGL